MSMPETERPPSLDEIILLVKVALEALEEERATGDIDPYGKAKWRLIDAAGLISIADGESSYVTGRFVLTAVGEGRP